MEIRKVPISLLNVALLAEGVDRNYGNDLVWHFDDVSPSSRRAWIEIIWNLSKREVLSSPSSRRAWIEIFLHRDFSQLVNVALLAEGVDRNIFAWFSSRAGRCRPPRGGRG